MFHLVGKIKWFTSVYLFGLFGKCPFRNHSLYEILYDKLFSWFRLLLIIHIPNIFSKARIVPYNVAMIQ